MQNTLWRLALVGLLAVAACGSPSTTTPPLTAGAPSSTTAGSPLPASPGATAAAAIEPVVEAMATAVEARDRDAYLALVDVSDPVFALEHTRWVADWAERLPVLSYALAIDDVAVDGATATGRLTATWTIKGFEAPRTASWRARFTGGPGAWRYAGEVWQATEAEHFRLLVAPGVDGADAAILPALPDVYDLVTSTLDYAPAGSMQIKVYADPLALVANTLLSLPSIHGWNEPGEALKLYFDGDAASTAGVVAHEFTHFVLFDRAGTKRTRMPWWLDEGAASFVASARDEPSGGVDPRLPQVAQWVASGELAAWNDMAVFEETPVELWQFVYPQGYAMVAYITDEYGAAKRNAWLAAMATAQTVEEATPAVLGVTFDQLDAGFRTWVVNAAT